MDRSFNVSWEDPRELGDQARAADGLEFLRAIRDEELPPAPIQRLLGFTLTEVEQGHAVFAADPGEQHYNEIGVVHAGFAATLLDSATGCAVQSTLPAGLGYTTLETTLNLLRPVTVDTGPVSAEGQLIDRGRTVATAQADLRDGHGKLLAHATATCLIVGD